MKRKPLAFALAFALLCTQLTGCGDKDKSNNKPASSKVDTSQNNTGTQKP